MKRLALIFVVLFLFSGCVSISVGTIDSIEQSHFGAIYLMEGYINLLEKHVEGEALTDRLQLIGYYLKLSEEINNYFQTLKPKE